MPSNKVRKLYFPVKKLYCPLLTRILKAVARPDVSKSTELLDVALDVAPEAVLDNHCRPGEVLL